MSQEEMNSYKPEEKITIFSTCDVEKNGKDKECFLTVVDAENLQTVVDVKETLHLTCCLVCFLCCALVVLFVYLLS